jgi:AcrR family transcriptional regulator
MSMPSDLSSKRRVPQQERAERRVAQLLEAAAAVLAEAGYDAATMTEIAERANASIGAVYQYFPNKEAIVLALRVQYGDEMQKHWADLQSSTAGLSAPQIAHHLVDVMVQFVEEHPAYFRVLDAPVKYKRDKETRMLLRQQLADVFRSRKPALSQERAYRMANVTLQIIKSMNPLYGEASTRERSELVKEYKLALAAYLESQLVPQRGEDPANPE